MSETRVACEIIPGYPELAAFTGACIPNLRKLINRKKEPLPSVRLSPRKIVFVKVANFQILLRYPRLRYHHRLFQE